MPRNGTPQAELPRGQHRRTSSPALQALRDFLIPLGKHDCFAGYVGSRVILVHEEGWSSAEAKLWNCLTFEKWREERAQAQEPQQQTAPAHLKTKVASSTE